MFKKGISGNPSGRPKGSTSKSISRLRALIGDILDENYESVKADFRSLTPKDRIDCYIKLLSFVLPPPPREEDDNEGEFTVTSINRTILKANKK